MAELNPYKLEEEKWTPKNVYEILPPNAVSWSDYDFGQGTDNVDKEAANKSLIDGVIDFFSGLLGTAGQILGGAIELGVGIFTAFAEGISSFIGEIADAINGVLTHDGARSTPIRDAIVAQMGPVRTQVSTLGQNLQKLSTEVTERIDSQEIILGETQGHISDMSTILDEQKANLAKNQADLDAARQETSTAIAQAGEAVSLAKSYNTTLNERITTEFNSAVGRADAAVDKADGLIEDLDNFKQQHQRDIDEAIGKAEQASQDLAALSPQVESALAESSAANQKVADLTPQVSDAVSKAGAAVSKADQTLADYTAWASAQKTRIDSAVSKAEKASSDLATLTPKVTDAVSKANKASSDVSALTPQVSAAQSRADAAYTEAGKVRSEVTPKIEAAQTKGETALAAADKAIADSEFVAGFADDLIPKDENGKSTWSRDLASVDASPEGSAFGSERTFLMDDSLTFPEAFVPVKGQEVYRLTVWIYRAPSSTSGAFSFHVLDKDSQRRWAEARLNLGSWETLNTQSMIYTTIKNDTWEKHVLDFRWPENLGSARIRFQLNSGSAFYIHDPQVRVIQPLDNSVDRAQNETLRAHSEILRQQDEINEAQRVANLAQQNFNDNQKKWSDGVDVALATQKTVNDNFKKWTDGATTAIAANTTAIKALSTIDTGESLIAYLTPSDAEVKAGTAKYDVPVWTTATQKQLASNHSVVTSLPSPRKGVYGVEAGQGNKTAKTVKVKVRPHTKYLWSFWSWGSGDLVIYMYGDGGGYPVRATRQIKVNQATQEEMRTEDGQRVYDPAQNGNRELSGGTQWLLNGFDFGSGSGWKFNMYEVEFTSTTTEVWFDTFYWNWRTPSTGGQYLADMQFYPDVPTQAQVDAAQNKALEAHDLLFERQDEWNEGTKAALDAQKKVDDNFKKWTDGATEAIEANKNAIKALNAPQMGTSVIPLIPGTNTPAWTANADWSATNPTAIKDGDPTWYRFDGTRDPGSYNLVAVDSTLEYDFSVWIHGTGSSVLYVELRDQDGNHAVQSGTITSYTQNNGSKYLIENMTLRDGWRKVSTTITLNPGVKFINVNKIYGNHPNGGDGSAYLADMRMVPHVPTQASVDKAQNDAISANTEAVKALGKKSLGASLVPYKTPSTQEVKDYAAGRLNYDPWADPEYLNAGHWIASPTRGRVARADSGHGTKNFEGEYVSVDSSVWHKVKFHTYASKAGTHLFIYMVDQNGDLAFAETPFADKGRTSGGLVHGLTLPAGIKEWSGVVKFKNGTTQVKLGTFYWNHPNGSTTGTQEFGGLEIVPDVPTQDDLNLSFDNNFKKIDKELGLIKSTDASFRADQTKWNKASKDATDSLLKFQGQQTEINDLVQEQLWTQLDMIEQLDIQTPRVFHRKTAEGSFQTAPSWTTWSTCRYHDSPFILHLTRYEDTRKMYWQAKGKWEGKLKVTTNWTNGASDVMVYDIKNDEAVSMGGSGGSTKLAKAARTYAEEGGAFGTNLRNSTFEIYPTNLGRTVGLRNTGTGWSIDESVMATGGPSLIRHRTNDVIRFTNSVVCNRQVLITPPPPQGGYNIAAGTVISPRKFDRKNFQVGVTYIFTEKPFITNTW